MAKISRLGGMSDAISGIYPVAVSVRTDTVHDISDAVSSPAETTDSEEEEEWRKPDRGGDSTTPMYSELSSRLSGEVNPFLPVPATGNPSSSDQTESGTANSMDSGNQNDS